MVVCAVRYEPVSTPQFPANREFAGNFADSGFRVPIPTLYLIRKSAASSEIPCATEQGIFEHLAGKSTKKQGICRDFVDVDDR
jgi:hypothetical protein